MKINIKHLAQAALFAALVALCTLIQVPVGGEYIHAGDIFLYPAALLLPLPLGMVAGALGAGLVDVFSGFAIFAPATVVVKALVVLGIGLLCRKRGGGLRWAGATAWSMVITVVGYGAFVAIVTDGFSAALAVAPFNALQGIVGAAAGIPIALWLRRVQKREIDRG